MAIKTDCKLVYQAAADAAKLLRAHRDVRTAYVTREAFTVEVA